MQEWVKRTYGFLTCVKHARIYVKLLGGVKLYFTIEDYAAEAGVNKQICEKLAQLLGLESL
jgi:hypothetical protein